MLFGPWPIFVGRGSGSFAAWLGGIAEHVIRHAAEKKSWGQLRLEIDVAGEDPTPSKNLRRGERFDRLERAIHDLDADQRTALRLARFEGLNVREIAAELGRSPKAVYKLLARAVLELKKNFWDTESLQLPHRTFAPEESRDEE